MEIHLTFKERLHLSCEQIMSIEDDELASKTLMALVYDAAKEGVPFEEAWNLVKEFITSYGRSDEPERPVGN